MRTPLTINSRPLRGSARPKAEPASAADNMRGAGLMALAMTFFTLNDAVIKLVTQTLPLYEAMVIRGLTVMVCLWLVAQSMGGLDLRVARGNRRPLFWRTAGEVGSTLLFLNALTRMEIGDLSAILQSLPLVVTLAAFLLFGEPLGWRRMLAIAVGLVGVLMILRPGTSAFTIWSALGVGAVILIALRDLATRRFSRNMPSTTIAFYAALAVTVTAAILSVGQGWQTPSAIGLLLTMLGGAILTVGYVTVVATMRVGEISFVAPFRYVSLVVAILLGLVMFGDWPDLLTWAGSALVVVAGIYSIWREGRIRRGA